MNKEYIKDFPVSKLIPYERNPRINKHAIDALAKAIKRVGNNDPIEITPENLILCGHTRKMALDKLGIKTTDVVVISGLTEAQQIEYRITNNKTGELAEWDFEILEADFSMDELIEFGFNAKDLTKPEVIEDDVPPVPEIARTVKGDIYTLGNHRVMCGDSTMIDDVEKLMDGKKADMVFTDPPYGVNYDGGASNKKKRDKIKGDDTADLFKYACKMSFDFSTKNAPLYLWFAVTKEIAAAAAAAAAGYEIRCELIWNKLKAHYGAFTAQYMQKHESCYYCFKKGNSVNWCGPNNEVTVWDIEQASKNEFHPTQNPVALSIRAIRNHSVGLIVDWFLGSGSTLIACEQTNRICYGMELDEKYCDVIVQRWVNFTGGKVILNGKEIEWNKI